MGQIYFFIFYILSANCVQVETCWWSSYEVLCTLPVTIVQLGVQLFAEINTTNFSNIAAILYSGDAVQKVLCAFFWVIPRRQNFICRRFGTLSVPSRTPPTLSLSFLLAQSVFEPNLPLYKYSNFSQIQSFSIPTCLCRWDRVPKRRHIKLRRRVITQKKSMQYSEHGENLKSLYSDYESLCFFGWGGVFLWK